MRLILIFISTICIGASLPNEETIFYEEFGGNVLNEHYWNYELGDGCPTLCGWGNEESQLYRRENAKIENGHLVIQATYEDEIYESARLTTKNKIEFMYGTVEVKAKLPSGKGLWPAIWMLGNDIDENTWPGCGEIDIMEYAGSRPGVIHTSLHSPSSFGETINTRKTSFENIEEGFHIYKMKWTKHYIKFFIDGEEVYTYNPEVKNEKTWPFNKPFYLLVNLAVGGKFGGHEIDNSVFPSEFVIDYIKINQ